MTDALLLTLPEIILSVAALALMMAAAWMGDRARRLADLARGRRARRRGLRDPRHRRRRRHRLRRAVRRRQLRRLRQGPDLSPPPRSSLVAASGWFSRDGDYRAEYPVLILLSSVGMGMMVSAGDLLTLYVGLELQSLAAYVLASFQRRDNRSAEAGLKYFVLGALASGILLYGISLLYGFTGSTLFGDMPTRRSARDGVSTRRAVRNRLRPRRDRLQGLGGAVPHVDSRRLRRRADPGHRLLRLGAQGRGDGAARPGRGRGDGAGHRSNGARSSSSWRWPRPSSAGSPRSASATSSGCSPTARSTMSASL